MQRQQAGMELDGAELGNAAEILRRELGDIGHHADLGVGLPHCLERGGIGQPGELMHRHAAFLGGDTQRIGAPLLRGAEHGRHRIAAVEERLQRCLAEILLANDGDPHVTASRGCGSFWHASMHGGPALATVARWP